MPGNSIRQNDAADEFLYFFISHIEESAFPVQSAELLLRQTEQMIRRVRDYDKASRTITIGTCTPVPVPEVVRRVSRYYPETVISSETKNPVRLLDGVKDGTYQMILLPLCPEEPDLIAYQFGEEHLSFLLPKRHRFARRKSLSVAEMNGENMLLFHDIGFWHDLVVEKMPDSRFLIQTERYSFRELIENSTMPVFTTDALPDFGSIAGRIAVPISDPEFNVTYYVICRKKDKQKYAPLFE